MTGGGRTKKEGAGGLGIGLYALMLLGGVLAFGAWKFLGSTTGDGGVGQGQGQKQGAAGGFTGGKI